MHTEELGTNVPAFLAKLWKMVEDPETNDLISWSSGGTSFYIRDQARFARELLPLYYKHNNMASFVRQLNMYGFHKVVSIEGGGLKVDKDEMEFAHQCFLMGHPYLLEHIKRKISVNKAEDNRSGSKPELVNKVLTEVKNMKGRQDSVDSQLSAMKRENEVLWREVAILRQKHIKQQQIVNKLIQFLVSMVQSSRSGGIGMKRHYPLMLNDITNRPSKSAKMGTEFPDLNSAANNLSPTGPVIHELDTAELLDDCEAVTEEVPNSDFLVTNTEMGEVQSPASPQDRPKLIEETGPEVLLEFADDYSLNPEMLVQVSPAEINPTLAPRLMQKPPKIKSKDKAIKKHKNSKVISNLKLKLNTAKKSQSTNSIKQEQVDTGYCSIPSTYVEDNIGRLDGNAEEVVEDSVLLPDDISLSVLAEDVADDVPGPGSVLDEVVVEGPVQPEDILVATTSNNPDMTLACAGVTSSPSINRCGPVDELDSHVDSMQTDLDGLKEILKGEGYSLDANTLLGVCPAMINIDQDALLKLFGDDILSYGLHVSPDMDPGSKAKDAAEATTVSGSELMAYPTSLDFDDIYQYEDWAKEAASSPVEEDVANSDLATPNPQGLSAQPPRLCQQ